MKKKDWMAVIVIAGLALSGLAWQWLTGSREGTAVQIKIDGELYGTYSLLEQQEIVLDTEYGHNRIVIENRHAVMREADCPDGYCMEQGEIGKGKETIICLPHKVVAEVIAQEDAEELDAVVR